MYGKRLANVLKDSPNELVFTTQNACFYEQDLDFVVCGLLVSLPPSSKKIGDSSDDSVLFALINIHLSKAKLGRQGVECSPCIYSNASYKSHEHT